MMQMYQILLWIVFPYSVIAIVGMALIWQYDTHQRYTQSLSVVERILAESIKGLFILSSLSGIAMIFFLDEYAQFFMWLLSLAMLHPDVSLILNISILPKAHFIITLLFLLALAFSNKIIYLLKPHLFIKSIYMKLSYEKRHL